jgi:hypothetical protein
MKGRMRWTAKRALAQAQKLWGDNAAVQAKYDVRGNKAVGYIMMGMFFEVRGVGKTWDEAFKAASKGGSLWSSFEWPPKEAA